MLEAILPHCESYVGGDGQALVPLKDSDRALVGAAALRMAREGLRVLAVAWGAQKNAFVFGGLVGMLDPPRPGVRDSIALMRQSRIRVAMVTGDARETAESIAAELGFYDKGVDEALSGQEMEYMSPQQVCVCVLCVCFVCVVCHVCLLRATGNRISPLPL
jgi:Ca2+-transporting ATPase